MLESVGVEEAWPRGEDSRGRWAARKGGRWPRQGRGWTPQIGAESDDLLATVGVELGREAVERGSLVGERRDFPSGGARR
jgi:hypothetical protein